MREDNFCQNFIDPDMLHRWVFVDVFVSLLVCLFVNCTCLTQLYLETVCMNQITGLYVNGNKLKCYIMFNFRFMLLFLVLIIKCLHGLIFKNVGFLILSITTAPLFNPRSECSVVVPVSVRRLSKKPSLLWLASSNRHEQAPTTMSPHQARLN